MISRETMKPGRLPMGTRGIPRDFIRRPRDPTGSRCNSNGRSALLAGR